MEAAKRAGDVANEKLIASVVFCEAETATTRDLIVSMRAKPCNFCPLTVVSPLA